MKRKLDNYFIKTSSSKNIVLNAPTAAHVWALGFIAECESTNQNPFQVLERQVLLWEVELYPKSDPNELRKYVQGLKS